MMKQYYKVSIEFSQYEKMKENCNRLNLKTMVEYYDFVNKLVEKELNECGVK